MSTIIGKSIFVAGNIEGDGSLIVAGKVEGGISVTENLTIENNGVIKGDIRANEVIINGLLVGSIEAKGIVRLNKTSIVVGDIIAPRVLIEADAKFRGSIDMSSYDSLEVKPVTSSFSKNRLNSKKNFNRFETKKIESNNIKTDIFKEIKKKQEVKSEKNDYQAPAINNKLDKEESQKINDAVEQIVNEKKNLKE